MTLNKETKAVLEMLASGKINASEAAVLLGSGKRKANKEEFENPESTKQANVNLTVELEEEQKTKSPSWFHVQVSDLQTGKEKVLVNIPLRLIKLGFELGRHFAPELIELNQELLDQELWTHSETLVDVRDAQDGERVLIFVD